MAGTVGPADGIIRRPTLYGTRRDLHPYLQKILPLRLKPRILKNRQFATFFRLPIGAFIAHARNKRWQQVAGRGGAR
jgi:hypothetical protein